ncbi:hypothetical protein SAMN05421766_10918 [Zobellia uliginosa]|uniref:Hsp20/alpha crystallin family protein n=1 Tax=Zobellia uliginosa TaxID=143224 RepID=A0ABY1L186_9FLAO|nr:hypothetical protein [Zobellia uliginosa]SIT08160.1 hypothetical protein SAMN05421766_10918 [Zobellia uliginosa]
MDSRKKNSLYKNRLHRHKHFPSLNSKNIQLKLFGAGSQVIVPPNFLKNNTPSLRVRNGMLHLKLQGPGKLHNYNGAPTPHEGYRKGMDFHIRLPDRLNRHLNSVRYQNGIVKIQPAPGQKANHNIPSSMALSISNNLTIN